MGIRDSDMGAQPALRVDSIPKPIQSVNLSEKGNEVVWYPP